MKQNDKTRCDLRADVYTYNEAQFYRTVRVSRLFPDSTSTEEAADVLEALLWEKVEAMGADPGTPALCPDLQDMRLDWA